MFVLEHWIVYFQNALLTTDRFSIILTLNTLYNILASEIVYDGPAAARGFFNTRMTLSPRRNILEMNLSLLTGLAFFFPDNKELN